MKIVKPKIYREKERKHGKVYERERVVLKLNLPIDWKDKEVVVMTRDEYEKMCSGIPEIPKELLDALIEFLKEIEEVREKDMIDEIEYLRIAKKYEKAKLLLKYIFLKNVELKQKYPPDKRKEIEQRIDAELKELMKNLELLDS